MSGNHVTELSPFDFANLAPAEVPVKNLFGHNYVLVEATEDAAIRFRNRAAQSAKVADGKVVGVEAVADLQVLLLSMCLVELNADGSRKTRPDGTSWCVPQDVIRRWPSRVVRPLFEKAKEISALGELESPEAVRKQIDRLQDLLAEMEEGPSKNGSGRANGTSTSASPQDSASTSTS